jgi:microsomal epoxide hydrolase
MSSAFASCPSTSKSNPIPFKVEIHEDQIAELKTLIKLSKLAPKTYENQLEDGRFGISRSWLANAKAEWETWSWYV